MSETVFGHERDVFFMKQALSFAQKGLEQDEVPIGAVLVNSNGEIVGGAHNSTEIAHTQQSHAEMVIMHLAATGQKDWRLQGCWLYVTLEPCLMCLGCALLSRVTGIVYGAQSPLFGSVLYLDKVGDSSVYKMNMPIIVAGVCADDATKLLKQFFKKKRE